MLAIKFGIVSHNNTLGKVKTLYTAAEAESALQMCNEGKGGIHILSTNQAIKL